MKIYGYRSKKGWKMALATFGYGFILLIIILTIIDPSADQPMDTTTDVAKVSVEEDIETVEEKEKREEAERIKAEEDAVQARKEMIESQFSLWDGSHTALKNMIKDAMNDPKSFEHDETLYSDDGDYITVQTKYRGRNGFGGMVKGSVIATFTLKGDLIEVISQE